GRERRNQFWRLHRGPRGRKPKRHDGHCIVEGKDQRRAGDAHGPGTASARATIWAHRWIQSHVGGGRPAVPSYSRAHPSDRSKSVAQNEAPNSYSATGGIPRSAWIVNKRLLAPIRAQLRARQIVQLSESMEREDDKQLW